MQDRRCTIGQSQPASHTSLNTLQITPLLTHLTSHPFAAHPLGNLGIFGRVICARFSFFGTIGYLFFVEC